MINARYEKSILLSENRGPRHRPEMHAENSIRLSVCPSVSPRFVRISAIVIRACVRVRISGYSCTRSRAAYGGPSVMDTPTFDISVINNRFSMPFAAKEGSIIHPQSPVNK